MIETNKIYNGDCLEVMKDIQDNSIDMILTEPPYGINYQSNMRVVSEKFKKIENDDNNFRFEVYKEFPRLLKENCVAICFCSFKNYAEDYIELKKYFDIKNCIIWFKGGGGIGDLKETMIFRCEKFRGQYKVENSGQYLESLTLDKCLEKLK